MILLRSPADHIAWGDIVVAPHALQIDGDNDDNEHSLLRVSEEGQSVQPLIETCLQGPYNVQCHEVVIDLEFLE